MITNDTPLAHIALLLPAEQARRLDSVHPFAQESILTDVRMVIAEWEQSGLDLDPITFERVLGPVVDQLLIVNLAALRATLEERLRKGSS